MLRQPGLDVLLITVDTLRADALGSYGNPKAVTPWMDRLAAAGVRFENARAHNVVTLPAHASILTGLYPQEHGVRDNSGFRFPSDLPTLGSLFQQQGYRTGAFVSAFPLDSRFGLDRGFDIYEDSFVGAERRPAFLEQERAGVETVALARSWIEAGDERPWFCWVHLYEPHFPYAPSEPFRSRFANNPYLGDVAAADAALAPLLEPILAGEDGGQTLVVLTSDHGEALGEHGESAHGIFAYEGSLRVPVVVFQPRLFEPRVVSEPVGHVDLLPTILDVLALPIPENLRGRSLLPAATGESGAVAPPSYFEALSGQLNRGWAPLYGVIDGNSKFIDLPIPELYELGGDPSEQINLAADEPERVSELKHLLAPLRAMDPGSVPTPEDAETLERLESLGYLGSQPSAKSVFTEEDDPKRLMELDVALQEVAGLYSEGNLKAALQSSRDVVGRRPGMRLALMELAHLERESGNLEAAIEALQQAYALNPADSGALALLGAYLTQAGRANEAVEITEPHARRTDPDIDILLVRALALARTQAGPEAFAAVGRASQIDPRNPSVPVHLGTLYLMSGDRDRARQAFQEALALNSNTVAAHTALGVMEVEDGNTKASLEHWHRATVADPSQYSRLLAFGTHLWTSGQIHGARAAVGALCGLGASRDLQRGDPAGAGTAGDFWIDWRYRRDPIETRRVQLPSGVGAEWARCARVGGVSWGEAMILRQYRHSLLLGLFCLFIGVSSGVSVPATSQEAPADSFGETVEVELINVEVRVLDKQGHACDRV